MPKLRFAMRQLQNWQHIWTTESCISSTGSIFDVERYVGWCCILNSFMLLSLPCFYAFCWSAIPTTCYSFNDFILYW